MPHGIPTPGASEMWVLFPEGPDNIVGALRRATITKTDDAGDQQLVDLKGYASEVMTKVVRDLPHGFSSNAPANAAGILLSLGGRADRAMLIGGQDAASRPRNVPVGAAVLYDDKGNVVFVKGKDGIVIAAKSGAVSVTPESGKFVFLGGDGETGAYDFVSTVSGPSINVKARIG